MWVGPQISEKKIAFSEKNRWVLKMLRKKSVIYGKNWWVGTKHHSEQIFSISANICLTPLSIITISWCKSKISRSEFGGQSYAPNLKNFYNP